MNTTKFINYSELEEGTLKALALMQYNDEDFFILSDASESIAYEGKEEDAKNQFNEEMEGKEGITDFYLWAKENLSIVEPIEGDEERDNYMVLTYEEADEKAKEYILNSLWAFNPSFLSEHTELDQEVFEAIQANGKCEENNDTIYRILEKMSNYNLDDFVSAAISADGRGHFMSSYDGNENEETIGETTYYIYRIN